MDGPGNEYAAWASGEGARQYFDEIGIQELDRLVKDVRGRVSLEVHLRFLARFVQPGWRVLEIGAGPGRFTVGLARLGAKVLVTDISGVQLRLNAEFVAAQGYEKAVERREVLDLREVGRFGGEGFDAVVAFGGPLSYLFEGETQALAGMLSAVRPGGVVLASVMSLYGTWRVALPIAAELDARYGPEVISAILATGDLRVVPERAHVCRLFTWDQVVELVEQAGGTLLTGSASNWASLGDSQALAYLEADEERWSRFLDQETMACNASGARDGGTHVLFAAGRRD
ncbi:SAM-dependent methyltransferase [Streptacidiphilus sp. BW17]|uniref:class I SAM-dependent methyltransferase n=1 Tax=unclassified Streptacidiphilus TaxID=2643834 RepID=UPI0035197B1E